MLHRLAVKTMDLMIHPQICNFGLKSLRLGRDELERGASLAAASVARSYQEACDGDFQALDDMAEAHAVDAKLHQALSREIQNGQNADAVLKMKRIHEGQLQQLQGSVTMQSMRLVVGARRETFCGPGSHWLALGSHLIIVGAEAGVTIAPSSTYKCKCK